MQTSPARALQRFFNRLTKAGGTDVPPVPCYEEASRGCRTRNSTVAGRARENAGGRNKDRY